MLKDLFSNLKTRRKIIDADATIVAFPRCGVARLRDLLWNYLAIEFDLKAKRRGDFIELWKQNKSKVPRIAQTNDEDPHTKFPDEIRMDKVAHEGKKVIFLARDPRNVIASLFYRRSRRGYIDSNYYWGTLTDFIREGEGSFETLLTYYASWASPERVKIHHVSYETLHEDPAGELFKIAKFLGIKPSREACQRAVVQTPAFGEQENSNSSVPRKSAYLEPELPDEKKEGEEKPKEPYLREFDDEDLKWLRIQMDSFLPDEFPFYKEDPVPEKAE